MKSLKQCAADWCFFKDGESPEEYYRALKSFGYTGIEMPDPLRWPVLKAAGLSIISISGSGMEVGLNRYENHATLIPQIEAQIIRAAKYDIRNLIIFSGNRKGQNDQEGLQNCIGAIKKLAKVAEKKEVTLLFEMLCSADHADYQADSSAYGFALAKAVASPYVKVLYDIYHMHEMGEDVLADIVNNLDLIGHIHIAGSNGRHFPDSSQKIDYKTIVSRVIASGYRGYWGQEFVPLTAALEEARTAAELFNSYILK